MDNNVKTIITSEMVIRGNIMTWSGTMLQLSNISCISTSPMAQRAFPVFAIVLILVAFLLFSLNWFVAVLLLAGGGGWIYFWYTLNEKIKQTSYLNLLMNSGTTLQILFSDPFFLEKVLTVLENIIENGYISDSSITISISGCKIDGNAKILNNLNINR